MTTSNTTQTSVTVTTLARVNVQSMRYTDNRVSALAAQINVMQAQIHRERTAKDKRMARDRLIDRITFLVVGAGLGLIVSHLVLPAIAVAFLGISPDIARETFEFFKRL